METFWDLGGGKAAVPLKYETNFEKNHLNTVRKYHIYESKSSEKISFSKVGQKQNDIISLKSDFILKLQVAKSFKDTNVFLFIYIFIF